MKFTGKGFYLGVDEYTKTNKDGEVVTNFKYHFLYGERKKDGTFPDPTMVSCVADHKLLIGDEKLMQEIDIEVDVRKEYRKVDGKVVVSERPVFSVKDLSAVK